MLNRKIRPTRYGNPIEEGAMSKKNQNLKFTPRTTPTKTVTKMPVTKSAPVKTYAPKYVAPKFYPVSDEVTVYGAKKYRTPYRKDQFTGTQGSKRKAVILDIDGTIQSWGSGLAAEIKEWLKKHYDAGDWFVVITARDDFMYETSFNWLMRQLPYPFIGPFTRAEDDPRYASEFKRELAEDLSAYFEFVGAADDNEWVLKMWDQWAIDHFENPADFDIFRAAGHTGYADWRSELPYKGNYQGYGSYGTSSYVSHKGEHWVNGAMVNGVWQQGYWAKDDPADVAKNRPAGTRTFADGKALQDDPAWKAYFAKREKAGAYTGQQRDAVAEVIDEAIDIIDAELVGNDTALRRADLEAMVRYNYPGYKDAEIDLMDLGELSDLAGVSTTDWGRVPGQEVLFTNAQLGIAAETNLTPTQRGSLIRERMAIEDEVLDRYPDFVLGDVQVMDMEELEDRLDALEWLLPFYSVGDLVAMEHEELIVALTVARANDREDNAEMDEADGRATVAQLLDQIEDEREVVA